MLRQAARARVVQQAEARVEPHQVSQQVSHAVAGAGLGGEDGAGAARSAELGQPLAEEAVQLQLHLHARG